MQPANVLYKHILKYFLNSNYKGGVQGQIIVYFGSRPSNYSVVLGVIGRYKMIYQIALKRGVFSCLTATLRHIDYYVLQRDSFQRRLLPWTECQAFYRLQVFKLVISKTIS